MSRLQLVDFEALRVAAEDAGAAVTGVLSQGEWLRRLGIAARADALSRANRDRADDVAAALERLTSSEEMGKLFKVVAVHAVSWPVPAGLA